MTDMLQLVAIVVAFTALGVSAFLWAWDSSVEPNVCRVCKCEHCCCPQF